MRSDSMESNESFPELTMADGKLAQRVAVITGGGSGIGREIARLFAREGAQVAILDVDVQGAEDTARAIADDGGAAIVKRCDVSRQADVVDAFAAVAAEVGPVDILVNNAGISHVGTAEST